MSLKTIKVQVEDEIWELFYRFFPRQGERTRILRNFILKRIREEQRKKGEERDGG